MKILGIDFELLVPIQRHVETISATLAFIGFTALFGIGFGLNLFIIFGTPFGIIGLTYFWWIWIDQDTTQKGGRRSDWVRDWKIFQLAKDYFPISLTLQPGLTLDPKRNYLFAGFPHAIFPCGTIIALATKACNIDVLFPDHTVFSGTLDINLKAPLYRDFLMALGFCSVSANSLNHILQYPYGGKIALIIVGGAAEAYLSQPEDYKLVLKNRKGFVKLAIKNGTPLVPVYGFGEVNTFNQYICARDSTLAKFQEWAKNTLTFGVPIISGRGLFQKTFGITPFRTPINVVVGKPIEVVKNENPTKEEVEQLHQVFVDEITKLFEEYKHRFIEDAENKTLIIM